MTASLTALYAAILALIIVALGINVTVHRVKLGVSLGDGGKPQMMRMMRLHGNAAEYIPIAVLLMLIYELNGGSHMLLHVAGIVLIAGRLIQTMGMWSHDGPTPMRGIGQTVTWIAIAGLAALNLLKAM